MNHPFVGVERILTIKFRHIGDVLLTIPALKALKASFPDASITALVNSGSEEMLLGHPAVDEVITFHRPSGSEGPLGRIKEELRLLSQVRSRRFDMAVNFTEGDRGAIISLVSGARYRLGPDSPEKGMPGKKHLFTHLAPPQSWSRHAAEMGLALLAEFGIEGGDGKVDLFFPAEADRRAAGALADFGIEPGEPFVVIHPTSRWMYKAWTISRNAAVMDRLVEMGVPVVLTCGPDREEIGMLDRISGSCVFRPAVFPGNLTLMELAAVISRSSLFFGVDSAPMHMASALETPVMAIFGPTREKNWRPYSGDYTLITSEMDCRPCGNQGCDDSLMSRCIDEIPVSKVIDAITIKLQAIGAVR